MPSFILLEPQCGRHKFHKRGPLCLGGTPSVPLPTPPSSSTPVLVPIIFKPLGKFYYKQSCRLGLLYAWPWSNAVSFQHVLEHSSVCVDLERVPTVFFEKRFFIFTTAAVLYLPGYCFLKKVRDQVASFTMPRVVIWNYSLLTTL